MGDEAKASMGQIFALRHIPVITGKQPATSTSDGISFSARLIGFLTIRAKGDFP